MSAIRKPVGASDLPRPGSRGGLLFAVCLAQFMVILDVSIVNVALPSIRDGLHFSTIDLQWVVNAYTIAFAGFLMLGGRLADLLGRRRVFLTGTALFALSSLVCALADSRGLLIGARTLQGFAGAIVSPATLSIITSSFAEGRERNRGLAMWGAMGALGASSGALLGGILTQLIGWPAIFVINVPIGAVVILLGLRAIPAASAVQGPRHFDFSGAALVTGGLLALTFGIVRTNAAGWGSAQAILPLAAGLALIAGFLVVEARFSPAPLVPLSIFRLRNLRAANLVVLLLYAGIFPQWFFLTLYFQQVLHYTAIEAGLGFLPMTLSIFAGSTLAPRIVSRFGARRVITVGMLAAGTGGLLLTGVSPGGSYFSAVVAGAVVGALGMGFSLVPATISAMEGVSSRESGLASGLLNTSRLMGGALGLAVLSTIADAQAKGAVGVGAGQAMTDGFGVAFAIAAALCFAGAVLAGSLLRPGSSGGRAQQPVAEAESAKQAGERELLAA
ncbi:MAG: MFS transporter [Solirubrobacterales bacterium]|nr:MFS transporter [Solirubrobacterales bacterium]MBV9536079.1 MFS transporter [Solirubrobacterales bacterium]